MPLGLRNPFKKKAPEKSGFYSKEELDQIGSMERMIDEYQQGQGGYIDNEHYGIQNENPVTADFDLAQRNFLNNPNLFSYNNQDIPRLEEGSLLHDIAGRFRNAYNPDFNYSAELPAAGVTIPSAQISEYVELSASALGLSSSHPTPLFPAEYNPASIQNYREQDRYSTASKYTGPEISGTIPRMQPVDLTRDYSMARAYVGPEIDPSTIPRIQPINFAQDASSNQFFRDREDSRRSDSHATLSPESSWGQGR